MSVSPDGDDVVLFQVGNSISQPAIASPGTAVDIGFAARFITAFLTGPSEACAKAEVRFIVIYVNVLASLCSVDGSFMSLAVRLY